MSTMVERVARAIWDSHELGDFETASVIDRGFHVNAARAAIEAMVPFFKEIPAANFIRTSDADPGRIWSIAAEAQLGAVVGHLQAALKEQE